MQTLTVGWKYNTDNLKFAGWTIGDGSSTQGYSMFDYFGQDGEYLGPDRYGIEPIFEDVADEESY